MRELYDFSLDELRKLLHGAKLRMLILLTSLIGVASGLLSSYLYDFTNSSAMQSQHVPLLALELLAPFVLPLFMLSLGSELMVEEVKDGTAKNVFGLPLARESIYLGKWFAGGAAVALILLSLWVPAFTWSLVLQGGAAWEQLGGSLIGYGGAFVYCGLILLLSNTISLWSGSSGIGLLIGMVLWFAMSGVGFLYPELERFLPTSYAQWVEPLLSGGGIGATVTMLLFILAYYIMFTIFGIISYQRKEI